MYADIREELSRQYSLAYESAGGPRDGSGDTSRCASDRPERHGAIPDKATLPQGSKTLFCVFHCPARAGQSSRHVSHGRGETRELTLDGCARAAAPANRPQR